MDALNWKDAEIRQLRGIIDEQAAQIKEWKLRTQSAERKTDWFEEAIEIEKHYIDVLADRDETIRILRDKLNAPSLFGEGMS